jgi:nucleoside-diphosphate-sugar epimerase
MTALVTGATSFIGVALCEYLMRRGYTVYAVARTGSANLFRLKSLDGIRIVYADLADMESISGSLDTDTIDLFFHLAWEGTAAAGRNDAALQKKNIDHSLSAIDVAHRLHCRCFVMFGSQAEYGRVGGIIEETTPCHPQTEYGKAKLELCRRGGERCKELGIKYLHLRIFSVYGVNDHPWTLISSLVDHLLQNEDMALSECRQKWNFVYIDDAARQIVALVERAICNDSPAFDIYNIASEDTRVLKDFVEEVYTLAGGTGRLLYGKTDSSNVVSIEPSIEKLKKTIGFIGDVAFKDGIKRMIDSKNRK